MNLKKKQKRRGTLSVSAKMYEKLVAYSEASGESISSLVERLVRDLPAVEGR